MDGGQWSARATSDGTAGSSAQVQLDSTVTDLYYRARVMRVSQGANSVSLMRLRTASNGAIASAFLASTGKLAYRNDTAGMSTTSTQTVSAGLWHEVQMHVLVNGASSSVQVWLDGIKVVDQTDSLGTAPIGRLELGDPAAARTFDVAFDNVVADPMFIADAAAPTAPSNLHTTGVTATEVDLAWDAANDDVGVTGYRIYRDGAKVGEVDGSTLAYSDTTVSDASSYAYTVAALDAAGHESAPSAAAVANTPDATKPSAPSGLTATAVSANRIDLAWNAASDNVGVTEYRIYRDGSATPIASVDGSTLTYSDTSVSAATTYTYTVTAADAAGHESDASNSASASTGDNVAPSKPTGLSASAVSGIQINLSWTASSDNVGVTAYRIYRDGSANPVATVNAPATSYNDTGLTPATAYTYTVKAVDAAGNASDASDPASATTLDTVAPSKPAGLSATAVSGTQINLSWTASTDNVGVTAYRIFRNGSINPVATVNAPATTYNDTGLNPGTAYTYTVKAADAAGNASVASDPASATTLDTIAPTAPGGLTAATLSDSQIKLTWTAATDNVAVTGYRIFRNAGATPIGSVGGTTLTYTDGSAAADTAYSYTVKAVDAAGNLSPASTSASATTDIFSDGFESGNFSKWTSVNGLVIDTTDHFEGTRSAEANSKKNTVAYAVKQLPGTSTNLYYRVRFDILIGKPDTVNVLRFRTATGANLVALFYDDKKKLGYRNEVNSTSTTSSTTLSTGTWNEALVHVVVNGTASQVEVFLNGSKITALSKTDSLGTTPIGQIVAGEALSGHAYDFGLDNLRISRQP